MDWDAVWSTARQHGALRGAIDQLREASVRDASAAAYLATLYREGVAGDEGRPVLRRDARRSLVYARRAAKLGSVRGMLELADWLDGQANARSVKQARQMYLRLTRGGNTTAMLNLAMSYRRDGQHRQAVAWLRKAVALGDSTAGIELAKATFFGLGVRREPSRAVRDLVTLSSRERIDMSPFDREQCVLFVAQALLHGWGGLRHDRKRARRYLEEAAAFGSQAAAGLIKDLAESA